MDKLNLVFSYYDKIVAPLSPTAQALISLALLVFLVWQIYLIFRNGHWVFIMLLIVFLPGTWPAARQVGELIYQIGIFLIGRAKILF